MIPALLTINLLLVIACFATLRLSLNKLKRTAADRLTQTYNKLDKKILALQSTSIPGRSKGATRSKHHDLRASLDPSIFIPDSVHVLGWKQVRIGSNTVVGDDTWIGINLRDSEEPAMVFGENCFIGRRNFFSSGNHSGPLRQHFVKKRLVL